MTDKKTKIIFLDRDGVINKFPGLGNYVTKWGDLRLLPGSAKAIGLLTEAGFEINVISNQGCVARGLITRAGLRKLTGKMLREVGKEGGKIRGVFYCFHQASDGCACKKPQVTLFKKALGRRRVDLKSVYFVGDSEEDMQAGKNLGCRTVLVLSGRVKKSGIAELAAKPNFVKKDLWDAARWIIQKKR